MIVLASVSLGAAILLFVLGLVIKALGGAASTVLADEFKASAPGTAQKIIRMASRFIPSDAREDTLDTWLAEASQYEGRPLKALRYAIVNCLMAAPGLARELRPALQPASTRSGRNRRPPNRHALDLKGAWAAIGKVRAGFSPVSVLTGSLRRAVGLLTGIAVAVGSAGVAILRSLNRVNAWQLRLLGDVSTSMEQLGRGASRLTDLLARRLELLIRIIGGLAAVAALLALLVSVLEGLLGL